MSTSSTTTPVPAHPNAEPLPPMPAELTGSNWHEGLTRDEWDESAHHIVGWLLSADPAEFAKAVASARETVEADRRRRAARMAMAR